MLENILITLGIAAVFYVMIWAIRNDRARSTAEHRGLLRMREPAETQSRVVRNEGARPRRGRRSVGRDGRRP